MGKLIDLNVRLFEKRGECSLQDGSCLINKAYGLGVNLVRNFHTLYTNFTGSVIEID